VRKSFGPSDRPPPEAPRSPAGDPHEPVVHHDVEHASAVHHAPRGAEPVAIGIAERHRRLTTHRREHHDEMRGGNPGVAECRTSLRHRPRHASRVARQRGDEDVIADELDIVRRWLWRFDFPHCSSAP
jgi:hypothetical protein